MQVITDCYMIKKIILGTFLMAPLMVFSQEIIQPNYGLKSHETLVINSIEKTSEATTFHMTIENRITNGAFCADRNIFMIYPDGTGSTLIAAEGIPVCPDYYPFKTPGERLRFTLKFPPLKENTVWIDLIEDCDDNCFHFYGIVLDKDLNDKINNAFTLVENNEPSKALSLFTGILEETDSYNYGSEGLLYVNIIRLANETGETDLAAYWYKKLRESGAPRLDDYLRWLKEVEEVEEG